MSIVKQKKILAGSAAFMGVSIGFLLYLVISMVTEHKSLDTSGTLQIISFTCFFIASLIYTIDRFKTVKNMEANNQS